MNVKKKFYITTAIAYVNAPPHIGHALEFLLTDVIARYRRQEGDDVFFLTGTDEHGAKIARAAEAVSKTPRDLVDENAARFQELDTALHISADDFIRTSDQKRHWPGAQALWRALTDAGDIYKGMYNGLYCIGCEAFITEKDLVNGMCEIHGKPPEVITEENYFFRLSKHQNDIRAKIESGELAIVPAKRKNEVLAFLEEGLQDVSFSRPSRDIPWGVPVPQDASATMYVWCDALSNYITALGYGTSDTSRFETYWPADIHVIGKDIVRFHALIWIGMLLSAKLSLPKSILVHGFITSGGKKMSKSLGNVIDPHELIATYGAEAVRCILLREVPTLDDGDLTPERIAESYNAHLANGLGNVVSRSTAMVESYFGGNIARPSDERLVKVPLKRYVDIVPAQEKRLGIEGVSVPYIAEETIFPEYRAAMDAYRLHDALEHVWRFISLLDTYVQDYEPFKLIKTDEERTHAMLWQLLVGIEMVAYMLLPFMPETAAKIALALGIDAPLAHPERTAYAVKKGEALFPRIEKKA